MSNMHIRRKPRVFASVLMITLMFISAVILNRFSGHALNKPPVNSRKLLEYADEPFNCTPRSVDQFPPDFLTLEQKLHGGIILHFIIIIYIFGALAIVCDDYFVASLEKITTVLKLQPDVAGATFMAAGSSAPELFTSIVGVFFAKSDVGLGTIIGSAVFNILFIIAICGLFSGMVIYLTWWPLLRDSTCYLISVIALVLIIYDNTVTWYESMVMVILYILYILLMYFNPKLGEFMIDKVAKLKARCCVKQATDAEETSPLMNGQDQYQSVYFQNSIPPHDTEGGELEKSATFMKTESHISRSTEYSETSGIKRYGSGLNLHGNSLNDTCDSDRGEYESPFSVPETITKKILWVLMLPSICLFFITIPDCRRPGCWQKTYLLTFVMSIAWIAGLSYVMVWMVTIAGDTLGIPDTVMGLTLLAAGTSVPDAMASLFVARDGYGDMAVSNSIGSNVFDILICLGLPWLLQTAAVGQGEALEIESKGLTFTAIVLFGTVLFLLVSMFINGWKLNKKFGVLCLVVYVVVIVICCLYESNIFMLVNLPQCPR